MNDMSDSPARALGGDSKRFAPRAPTPVRLLVRLASTAAPEAMARNVVGKMFKPVRRKSPLMPEGARPQSVSYGAFKLAAWIWDGDGPTVHLVHGWGGTAHSWSSMIEYLRPLGFRIVAFDLPAHGASEGSTTDVYRMADALGSVAIACGTPHAIVAHSIGAAAAVEFLSRKPPDCSPSKLVLIAPGGDLEAELTLIAESLSLSQLCIRSIRGLLESHFRRPLSECKTAAIIGSIDAELQLVHDIEDKVIPIHSSRSLSRAKRDSALLETRGLGHYKILQAPAVHRHVADKLGSCTKNQLSDPGGGPKFIAG